MLQGETSKWNVGVRQYPVLAEYAEPMIANGSSGISDTGLTMRAFLPIDSQGNRSSVHKYTGLAAVVDARVVCVRPNITILASYLDDLDRNREYRSLLFAGNVSIPMDLLKEAAASRVVPISQQSFNCSISQVSPDSDARYHPLDWDLSVCQLGQASGILKNAWALSNQPKELERYEPSTSYLLVKFSNRTTSKGAFVSGINIMELHRILDGSRARLASRDRGDWTDVYPTNDGLTAADCMLSFSLCFQASETQYISVVASSIVPLVQPKYTYDSESGRIRFDEVRKQMLSPPNTTVEQRGILSLEPQQWEGNYGQSPPYLTNTDIGTALKINSQTNYSTAYLLQHYEGPAGRADISIGGLLLEILGEGGTTAEAVQSMITTLVASRYQDYVFFERAGTRTFPASRADFVAVQIPGGPGRATSRAAGATRSYTLVMVAIAVHVLTVSFVVVWFCKGKCTWISLPTPLTATATRVTYLLESWSSISQVYSPMTVPYFKRAAFARDWEVKTWMEHKKLHKEHIVIERSGAVQEAPSTERNVRTRKGFVEEDECEQDLTSGVKSSQASERSSICLTELERSLSISSSTVSAIGIRESDTGS